MTVDVACMHVCVCVCGYVCVCVVLKMIFLSFFVCLLSCVFIVFSVQDGTKLLHFTKIKEEK
jgi:hypothetical protein